jgi:hypothetical protein
MMATASTVSTVNVPKRGKFQGYTVKLGEAGDLSQADLRELLVCVVTDLWVMADAGGNFERAVDFEDVLAEARVRFLEGALCRDA